MRHDDKYTLPSWFLELLKTTSVKGTGERKYYHREKQTDAQKIRALDFAKEKRLCRNAARLKNAAKTQGYVMDV